MDTILTDLYNRKITPEEAKKLLESGYVEINGIAKYDFQRQNRCGIPEVVISEGKRFEHLLDIVRATLENWDRVIVSRCDDERVERLVGELGGDTVLQVVRYPDARGLVLRRQNYVLAPSSGVVGVITAGTSDVPVAEEAVMMLRENGIEAVTAYDVGVAGLHRLVPVMAEMQGRNVDVYVVCAGREGTLPSLVAGLVDAPVIGVPVSTGYGEGGKGKAALYSMLQSCAPLVVVNIDAGLVAGIVAVQISNKIRNMRRDEGSIGPAR